MFRIIGLRSTERRLISDVRLDPPHSVGFASEDKPCYAKTVAQENPLKPEWASRLPLSRTHLGLRPPVRQFIHREDRWAVGSWNEPNKRPEATAQERRCAESESLDRVHGYSAPCLIRDVLRCRIRPRIFPIQRNRKSDTYPGVAESGYLHCDKRSIWLPVESDNPSKGRRTSGFIQRDWSLSFVAHGELD